MSYDADLAARSNLVPTAGEFVPRQTQQQGPYYEDNYYEASFTPDQLFTTFTNQLTPQTYNNQPQNVRNSNQDIAARNSYQEHPQTSSNSNLASNYSGYKNYNKTKYKDNEKKIKNSVSENSLKNTDTENVGNCKDLGPMHRNCGAVCLEKSSSYNNLSRKNYLKDRSKRNYKNNEYQREEHENKRQYEHKNQRQPFENHRRSYDSQRQQYENQRQQYENHREPYENQREEYESTRQQYENHRDEYKNHRRSYENHRQQYESPREPYENYRRGYDNHRQQNFDFKLNKKQFNSKNYEKIKEKDETDERNRREQLIDQLTRNKLECLVCCDRVYQIDQTWNCKNCYHIFHLKCIIKWAKSSRIETGWRCPACQNVTQNIPYDYYCFCGNLQNPEWNRIDCPHSCGEVCGQIRGAHCTHVCNLLCHPGPCPPCMANVNRICGCGRTNKSVRCDDLTKVVCENKCEKILACGVHHCEEKCHESKCNPCSEVIHQVCYCGKEIKDVACALELVGIEHFMCNQVCGKLLDCKNHHCPLLCHEGPCQPCQFSPDVVTKCPCGSTDISTLSEDCRSNCLDPIPTCEKICCKTLLCGQPAHPHKCQGKCHEGACPPCSLETAVKCRCGHVDKMIPCVELTTKADDARCDKKCTKKRSCGKHRCGQMCCIDFDHECPLPCNRLLSCGLHRCEDGCHIGYCKPCMLASFDELYCECGNEVIYPPIPCGTKRPYCQRPCSREHPCPHRPTHNCHTDPVCPPCTVLTQKLCYGRHELRKTVPCYQDSFSCGLPCNKDLSCGRHRCNLPCHQESCLKENQICSQPCSKSRELCGHSCNVPCHEGNCPETPCKETVRVTCECGHRSSPRMCNEHVREYQRLMTAKLASKALDTQEGQSIDIGEALKNISFKTLDCNEECKVIERNRRLAIGLQIRNPDLTSKLTPRYSDFMRQWAKKDPRFCQMVHDKLTDLVQLAKQSKQKSRSYSFDPMNRDKRHFIHECCEHFGVESVAYDQEPKRSIVATALKEKSWLPSHSLLEVIQKESGQRRIPILTSDKLGPPMMRAMEVLPSKITSTHQQSTETATTEPEIDYFDFT